MGNSLNARWLAASLPLFLVLACRSEPETSPPGAVHPGAQSQSSPSALIAYADLSDELGLDFVHFNGMSGEYFFPEMMGPGGAFVDYDGDGDLDLYLVQGSMLGSDKQIDEALFPPRHPLPLTDRLYRNDLGLNSERPASLRLTDVTDHARLESAGYGMGVAAGDIDNDGWVDLYVTNFGPNQLWRNKGDGTFVDATANSGADDPRWSVPAAFFDSDQDGWLDLYVGNYLDFTLGSHKVCLDAAGAQDYCGPTAYRGVRDRLFRNRRDGTFDDVSVRSGVGKMPGRTLGAVAADLDDDGWLDLYVANDGEPNFMWINHQDGSFRDEALLAGCAVNIKGLPEASMGVDAGDFDDDGDFDLFITHLTGESNTLYRNEGDGSFTDLSAASGLGLPSWQLTGFGTRWIDGDNDSRLDLVTLNGAVKTIGALAQAGDPFPLHQEKQLFRQGADGHFEERSAGAGPVFGLSEVGRGAAFGDVDNDGDTDFLVINNNGPARLLVNQSASPGGWLVLRPITGGGREALGAKVAVGLPDGRVLWRRVGTDGSYASASDPRVQIGLGDARDEVDVTVFWPSGRATTWLALEPGNIYTLKE